MIGRRLTVKKLLQCRTLLSLNNSASVFSTFSSHVNQQKQQFKSDDPVKNLSSDRSKPFLVSLKKRKFVGLYKKNKRDYMHFNIPNKWIEENNFPHIQNFQDLDDAAELVCLHNHYLLPYYLINNAYHLLSKTEPSKIASVILKLKENINKDSEISTDDFDRYFVLAMVKILSKQHFVKESFVTEKLKPLMICLKESGFKTFEDQRDFIYKELPEKYHCFSDIFLLNEEKLKSWTLLNRYETLQNTYKSVIVNDTLKFKTLLKSFMKANNVEFLNSKILPSVLHDTKYSINSDSKNNDRTRELFYDILLDECSVIPHQVANEMVLFYIRIGKVEKVKQVHSKDQTTHRLKRSFPVYFVPKEYLLMSLKCQKVYKALRIHLESMYGATKADWIFIASYFLEDMVHTCPKNLIQNLSWSSLRFFRNLFYSPSVKEVLPKQMNQLLRLCVKFEHFNVNEFLDHCFAYALSRDDFKQVESMIQSLNQQNIKIPKRLKDAVANQFITNDMNLPDSLELSETHQKLKYSADLKYVLQQLIMQPPSDKLTSTLIENYLCKIKPEQFEKVENILMRANSKFGNQLYEFTKLFYTRIKTLLDKKNVNEALVLVNENSMRLSPNDKEKFWKEICGVFSQYSIENGDIDVILRLNNCKLPVIAKNIAKVNLLYCKLKLQDDFLDTFVSRYKFYQLISITKMLVIKNDFNYIKKIYKAGWNEYAIGKDKFLRDFTSSLLLAGFSDDSLVQNLSKLEKSVCHGSYLTIFTKAISNITSPDILVHVNGYMKRHTSPCAMGKAMFIRYVVDAGIKMAPNLTRKEKESLELTLEECLRLYCIPGFYLHNLSKQISLQHHLKFDSMCNFISCPTIATDPNFDVLEYYKY